MALLKDCPVRTDWLGVLLLLSVIFLLLLIDALIRRRRANDLVLVLLLIQSMLLVSMLCRHSCGLDVVGRFFFFFLYLDGCHSCFPVVPVLFFFNASS
jgi:hypothetical protein